MHKKQTGRTQINALIGASTLLAFAICMPCCAADVYVSSSADGTPIYSTQSIDASSQLLIKGSDRGSIAESYRPSGEHVSLKQRQQALEPLILDVANRNGLDPSLVRAIAHVESRFNARAISPAGAAGVMQLMPGTAKRYGTTNRFDARQSLEAGARYIKDLLTQYQGNVALALAAYNSGEGNVERHAKRVPPFRETMLYVPEVLTQYENYRRADMDSPTK